MYEDWFGMVHTPFSRDVPADRLYESPAIADALGRLSYVADRQLFAVVTADAGCGKSTLIRRFAETLPKDKYILLYLSDSKLTPRWFYKGLLDQLGLEAGFYRGDAKRQLQREIEIIRGVQNKRVVCVLDEAHLLEKETLEEFRFLLNYRFDSMSPMVRLVAYTHLNRYAQKMITASVLVSAKRFNCAVNFTHETTPSIKDGFMLRSLIKFDNQQDNIGHSRTIIDDTYAFYSFRRLRYALAGTADRYYGPKDIIWETQIYSTWLSKQRYYCE